MSTRSGRLLAAATATALGAAAVATLRRRQAADQVVPDDAPFRAVTFPSAAEAARQGFEVNGDTAEGNRA